MTRSAAQLTTTIPRSLLVQSPSLSLDVHSRWMRRRSISRDSDVGVSLSVSYQTSPRALLRSHMPLSPLLVFADESPFPHHLGGRGARWAVCLLTFSCHPLRLTRARKLIRGIYDTSYLSYLRSILSLLPQFGLAAFVALHQDVWSRYAGGSGAPAWTLEHVGFDLYALEESGAAWLRGVRGGGHSEAERGLWPCGYQKLAAATMAWVSYSSPLPPPQAPSNDRY
jgi:hypothetical protein